MILKLLVISDTHGYIGNAVSLIEQTDPDYIIHLGDVASDCDELCSIYPTRRIICVLGNNDFFCKSYPIERTLEVCGKKIFMCHGHKYNVKYGLHLLKKVARDLGADIVLFGHTHTAFAEDDNGLTVLNPGSTRTYGLITIKSGNVQAQVLDF